MGDLLDRILDLWTDLPDDDAAAAQAFRSCYADPVGVNGTPFAATDMVARARALHRAFSELKRSVVERLEVPGKIVVVFFMRGVHTGPLITPLGVVAPTGREVNIRTIDVLTVLDGRVTEVWVVSDELGLLTSVNALALA